MTRAIQKAATLLLTVYALGACGHDSSPAANIDPNAPDEILFQEGLDAYSAVDYPTALAKFEELLSTYPDSSGWAANQLMMVELVAESDGPRLWRIAPTLNDYQGYWSEAFASLDLGARRLYWGANWNGADNLELYQAALCDNWWEALAAR